MRIQIGAFWILLVTALILVPVLSACSGVTSGSGPIEISPTETEMPVYTPSELPIADYRLVVDGLVDHALSLTYDSLLQYPTVSDKMWLICPGVFEIQKEWSGVPLTIILDEAGIKAEATRIKFVAVDGYSQELSTQDAQKEGVFLAYRAEGEVLSSNDGYPLRLVAKDQIGAVWVKRLNHIEVQ